MRTLLLCYLFISTCSFLSTAQCPYAKSLATAYNSNNGSRGAMFNINAINTVTITCFYANLYGGTTADYEIYYKTGSYVGAETNAAAWTFVGKAIGLYVPSNNTPTYIPISVNLLIPAGQTYGFYITNTASGGLNYTSSAVTNVTLASDDNFTITGGVGKAYPFSSTYNYRLINATAQYVVGVLPVELVSFTAQRIGQKNIELKWTTASETNNDYFTIERSQDALIWEEVTKTKGGGNSSTALEYSTQVETSYSGPSYYRLKQTDYNGLFSYSSIEKIVAESENLSDLFIFPNPTKGQVLVSGKIAENNTIEIYDALGQDVTSYATFNQNEKGWLMDLSNLSSGIYTVKTGTAMNRLTKE